MSALDLDQKKESKKISDEDQSLFSSRGFPRNRPSFSKIKSHLFKELRAKRYKSLVSDLESQRLPKEQIKSFFVKEGYSILYWAVTKSPDVGPLSWLCDLMDKVEGGKVVLQKLLLSENSKILEDFLFAESGLEIIKMDDEESRQQQVDKFKCLLRMHEQAVENFIAKKLSSHCWYLTEKIKANFKQAKDEFSRDNEPKEDLLELISFRPS